MRSTHQCSDGRVVRMWVQIPAMTIVSLCKTLSPLISNWLIAFYKKWPITRHITCHMIDNISTFALIQWYMTPFTSNSQGDRVFRCPSLVWWATYVYTLVILGNRWYGEFAILNAVLQWQVTRLLVPCGLGWWETGCDTCEFYKGTNWRIAFLWNNQDLWLGCKWEIISVK